ncbi:ABC-2 family transporter protein [Patescibacteria group bacterium]|nr:ABC-2 family transporter protein [Patescibacteria group bacterium]
MVDKIKRFGYYAKIWLMMSKNAFLVMLSNKKLFFMFLVAKLFRFGFFTAFLYFLVIGADRLAGYTVTQIIFFFLTFNLVDIISQFLFREVYRFRHLVVTGDFDLVLAKPYNSLFRVLMGGADLVDLVTIPPLILAVVIMGGAMDPTSLQVASYVLLLINGLLIAAAFHIAVLALAIITLEIDHTIMIYRDLVNLGRLPVDIYRQPLRGVLTYLIPVGVMVTLPAKSLMGLITPLGIFISLILGTVVIVLSLRFWNFAIKQYTSASS